MSGLIVQRLLIAAVLLGAAPQGGQAEQQELSFWEKNDEAIVVAIITAATTTVLVLFLEHFLKPLFVWVVGRFQHPLNNAMWRFIPRYRQELINRHSGVHPIGFPSRPIRRLRLSEAFVPLRLSRISSMDVANSYRWEEVLASGSCIAILGNPGTGKSTFVSFLLLIFAGHISHGIRKSLRAPLPLICRLREFGGDGSSSLLDLLVKSTVSGQVPRHFPQRLLRRGKCIIFFDGLDEVFDEEFQLRAVVEIERFVSKYPKNRFVLTCRTAVWRDQLPFVPFELQPLSNEEVGRFVGSWYREVLRSEQLASLSLFPSSVDNKNPDVEGPVIERDKATDRSRNLLKIIMKDEQLLLLGACRDTPKRCRKVVKSSS